MYIYRGGPVGEHTPPDNSHHAKPTTLQTIIFLLTILSYRETHPTKDNTHHTKHTTLQTTLLLLTTLNSREPPTPSNTPQRQYTPH